MQDVLTFQHTVFTATGTEPQSYDEAINSPEAKHWQTAMVVEWEVLWEQGTFEYVDLLAGEKAIGSRWVYAVKRDEKGEIIKNKARLVAQGISQQFLIHYDETFAHIAKTSTLRIILTMAAHYD